MKNLPYILNAILFILIIGLYIIHFSGNKPSEGTAEENTASGEEVTSTMKVAYVNMDTLFKYYEYFDDAAKELENKQNTARKNLEQRGRKFEQEMISYQRRAQAGLMSQNDIRSTEQRLAGQQEDLQKYSQTVQAGLLEEEALFNQDLYDRVKDYLEDYNKDKNFSVIINYTERSPTFWLAEDALDITKTVTDSLNARYESEKITESDSK